jgi:hypothetical protein
MGANADVVPMMVVSRSATMDSFIVINGVEDVYLYLVITDTPLQRQHTCWYVVLCHSIQLKVDTSSSISF